MKPEATKQLDFEDFKFYGHVLIGSVMTSALIKGSRELIADVMSYLHIVSVDHHTDKGVSIAASEHPFYNDFMGTLLKMWKTGANEVDKSR